MLKEFREFIMRGNVVDLAVGFVMGAAFTAIVTSLVDDIIMPIVGVFMGGVDFSSLSVSIGDATINYGNFIQVTINFLIIGFVIFLMVRSINQLQRRMEREEQVQEAVAPPEPSDEVKLLGEIRDLLEVSQD